MKIAIFGAGKLGLNVLSALIDGDNQITVIDTNENKLEGIAKQYDVLTYAGDAKRISLLKTINIHTYDFALFCTASDDINILSASFAKSLGCSKVVARVTEPEHMEQIDYLCQAMNLDAIINPDMIIAGEIFRYLIEKYSLSNGIFTSKKIAVVEIVAERDAKILNKSIKMFRTIMPNVLVAGISRNGKVLIPHGEDVIQPGDILYLVGERAQLIKYAKMYRKKSKAGDVKKVMIVGGGRTGYYLSKKLSEYGAFVKIIEQDEKRCVYLSTKIKNAMVLNGNGTDLSLLEEEHVDEMDAFVSVTGFDEENLLLALTAKSHGVDDVISKISHEGYDELVTKLGIDIVLNPIDISTSTILRIIRGSKRVISTVLLQGQAELVELYIDDNLSIVNTPLRKLKLPDYVLFAAINRNSETIIPDGNDVLLPGDHLIVICLVSHIGFIEKLLKSESKFSFLK